ncbi:MAG: PAC2 family protein [Promicromonosporaceae bacterium]|nr:PAC2 family protein [Promicromonosporaceae bacterium]
MLDPLTLLEWSERTVRALDLNRLSHPDDPGPVLIVAVQGFIDAGNIVGTTLGHLRTELKYTRLATFDVDQLVDYRGRRSQMTLEQDRWVSYDEPSLTLDYVIDRKGKGFLLLSGVEPDFQWERVANAIRAVIERFSVSLTITTHGVPMPVPHTRPLTLTARASRAELTDDYVSVFSEIRVPSSMATLLEYRLATWGHDAMGFAVHVPHYLARSAYPPVAVFALRHLERATGLDLGSDLLRQEASEITTTVEAEAAESSELQILVSQLEEQYDRFVERSAVPGLLDDEGLIPNAEDLAAQFEQYLRDHDSH